MTVRIGILGAGAMGGVHAAAYGAIDGVSVVGMLSGNEVRAGIDALLQGAGLRSRALLAVGDERARPDLQDPGRPLPDRLGHPVEYQVDLARNACADDA